ncbi:FAD-dependent oxidoreductase [Nocardiopsis sp. RSe5-2]|uniref:FAD-dependent oxidoreductase n=1 Tax=Nocardiopsis endophytica TaxID=3018445 RepID=A0ABT4UAG4_9ACTN|nr:FAD-dependent oxidoreductase [Nocardiopsis endophytica]MDA2813959.1 FAD-dependent oxidoreductase [Nocardiopsis endophytica]
MTGHPDAVVVGAGIVGAACAEALGRAGLRVTVVERGAPAGATTASGEGNVLVSDKEPGPELELARSSLRHWPDVLRGAAAVAPDAPDPEWDPKGGLVAALGGGAEDPLTAFASAQRAAGIDARVIGGDEARGLEPGLSPEVGAAVLYPQDAQLQPVAAATALLAAVRARGGEVRHGTAALGLERGASGAVAGLRTDRGTLRCGAVVNACGPWAGEFSRLAGAPVDVRPRRGMVLVTAPLPPGTVRRKVYDADYVGAVGAGEADLRTSTVVESTHAGTVLIGSSRQRVGFDDTVRVEVLRAIARKAVALFPALARVPVMRAYGGFRPYTPDHLPVIGEDPRIPGLWHATGHEGAGVGLAAGTGHLLAALVTGTPADTDPHPFRADRPGVALDPPPATADTTADGEGEPHTPGRGERS